MARLIMQEARGGQHGGVNAFAILAEYVDVHVDVYDEIGDHVQHIQDDHTSLPLINLVRVDANQPQLNMAHVPPVDNNARSNTKEIKGPSRSPPINAPKHPPLLYLLMLLVMPPVSLPTQNQQSPSLRRLPLLLPQSLRSLLILANLLLTPHQIQTLACLNINLMVPIQALLDGVPLQLNLRTTMAPSFLP